MRDERVNLPAHTLLDTDSYKVTHWLQYPPGMTGAYFFFESRSHKVEEMIFFGLQYYLMRHLAGSVITDEDIEEAKELLSLHFGGNTTFFNEAGWRYILSEYGGVLPVRICAVPEGAHLPVKNVLMTIENTDPRVPWIAGHLETILSMVWYPSTVATMSLEMKKVIVRFLEKTADDRDPLFKLHDFGFRGSTSLESAGIGAASHLVNFKGTDTLAGLRMARRYYEEPVGGFSIPAAEHSTMTSWGRNREEDAYRHMLETFPNGLVAVVSDSYNIYNACKDLWGKKLRDLVLSRNGSLVVRPDSGDPPQVVLSVLEILGDAFGTTMNSKGYKVLNPKVRVIQGDGIDKGMLESVLSVMCINRWSAENINFGSGGGLLQKVDRGTLDFAMKCSARRMGNGPWEDVFKDPITDSKKRSKRGRLALVKEGGIFTTVREDEARGENFLVPVFENGVILKKYSFDEVRARAST